ncbi:MAG TPA: hypothetical protein PKY73_18305 [Hyphomonas sp.]|nr:hypothetical protein [Hyphomonas sp.]
MARRPSRSAETHLRRLGAEASYTPTETILRPGGGTIGEVWRGAERDIATVSHRDMDLLLRQMLSGAIISPVQPPRYDGLFYNRPDGSRFGVR